MTDNLEQPELRGTGGWLGLLVFTLAIISPIRILLATMAALNVETTVEAQIGPNWRTYEFLSWFLAVLSIAGAMFLAWRLVYVQRRSTIGLVIGGLWVLALLPLLIDVTLGLALFPMFTSEHVAQSLPVELLRSAIYPTVWSAYLLRSRRVANTYIIDETTAKHIFG